MTANPKRGEVWLVQLDPTRWQEIQKTPITKEELLFSSHRTMSQQDRQMVEQVQ